MSVMLTLEQAQEQLLILAPIMGQEWIATEEALGRILASDIAALRTQPSSDLSAMDGYAIFGDGPWQLVGESRAGLPFGKPLKAGDAVRISTGAHMPENSDRVLIQENADVSDGIVSTEHPPSAGRHVRTRGFDFSQHDPVLWSGDEVTPGRIALALSAGHAELPVSCRPKVAILDSGDELVRDPANCGPDQIPANNGAMIAAMLKPLAGECARLGPVGDDLGALAKALALAGDADILITSGGASVGDHDLIQQALANWGAEIAFWKVAIKPGKPLMVATHGKAPNRKVIVGLPGNPVSSFVTAFLFALPLVRFALGMANVLPERRTMTLTEPLPATGTRHEFLRGYATGGEVRLAASQDSSALLALAHATCLIDRPPGSPELAAGDAVEVYSLTNG